MGPVQIDAGTALLTFHWLTPTVRVSLLLPPLPVAQTPALSAPEVMMRAAADSAGTVDTRSNTVTGCTMVGDGGTDLGRVVIIFCAADPQLGRIHLSGPAAIAAASYREDTWLRVEGTSRNRKLNGCTLFRPEDERQDCHRDRPPRQHVRLLILAP